MFRCNWRPLAEIFPLGTIGDLLCGGIVCHGCVFNPLLTVNLGQHGQPEGYGVVKGSNGTVKLDSSGGLDYLVGGEERSAFPAWLTTGSVDGGHCRIDNVDIKHLRGGHLEFDPSRVHDMHAHDDERTATHRRQDERETAGAGGEVCADLTGRVPLAFNGSEYLMVALRRETRFGFCQSDDKQTQRNNQRSDGGHAVAVATSLAFPQR